MLRLSDYVGQLVRVTLIIAGEDCWSTSTGVLRIVESGDVDCVQVGDMRLPENVRCVESRYAQCDNDFTVDLIDVWNVSAAVADRVEYLSTPE